MEKEKSFGEMLGEICRVIHILLDLNIEDEKIKQMLVKYFDIRYSQATNILAEEKEFRDF